MNTFSHQGHIKLGTCNNKKFYKCYKRFLGYTLFQGVLVTRYMYLLITINYA